MCIRDRLIVPPPVQAKALHILRGIAQKQTDLVGEGAAGQTELEGVQHLLQAPVHRVALPGQQRPHLGTGQLGGQTLRTVHQDQAPGPAGAEQAQLDTAPGELAAVILQQCAHTHLGTAPGDQIRWFDPGQCGGSVKGQGVFQIPQCVFHRL